MPRVSNLSQNSNKMVKPFLAGHLEQYHRSLFDYSHCPGEPRCDSFSNDGREHPTDASTRGSHDRVLSLTEVGSSLLDKASSNFNVAGFRAVFATMEACPHHTFQVLTKRSSRLRRLGVDLPWPPNIWMGVSVDDARVTDRIKDLAQVPAGSDFFSASCSSGPLDRLPLKDMH
jgi:hypothetical protein